MCGIGGIILKPARSLPDLQPRLQRLQAAMLHRGPDDGGIYISADQRVGLVNRRLAIRDLSPAGHMPMGNAEGTILITYNGEMFNADPLRAELIQNGCHFKSRSDTEVILQGYEVWGTAVVQRLRGQFAFAILDQRSGQVVLARDQMGVKPLYYAVTETAFVFASELKALTASGLIPGEISPTAIVAYLMWGSVPNPMTIYQGVYALPPASIMTISTAAPTPQQDIYWQLPTTTTTAPENLVEAVRLRLIDAVQSQMVSDVPLGAFLSGGLDSSAVVALLRQVSPGTIRTCSMVFEEAEYSESQYAQATATWLETEHFERVITQQDVIQQLDPIFTALDQPSIDGINTYFVAMTAREAGLTVALSGLGGDELFGGYGNTFAGVPRLFQALKAAQSIPGGVPLSSIALKQLTQAQRWHKLMDALQRPATHASAYFARRGLFAPSEVRQLVKPDIWDAAFEPLAGIEGNPADSDLFNWVSRTELRHYTHHQLLRDTDVMSMAHSLEVRVPLLDHLLVEDILRLPGKLKSKGNFPKPLLQQAVGDLLPPIVRDRKEKRGFVFPFDRWLKAELGDVVRSRFGETNRYLQPHAVATAWTAHANHQLHWSRLWALVTFQGWLCQQP